MNSEQKAKLAKARMASKPPVQIEFVNSGDIYKALEDIHTKFGDDNQQNQEVVKDMQLLVKDLINTIVKGIRITNIEDIKIEPKFNTPDVIVPEIKMPEIVVPEPTVVKENDIFSVYKPADVDESESTKYYGYLSKDGNWFIMRSTTNGDKTKYRYTSGKGNFSKSFEKRHRLNYDYIDKVSFDV